MNKFVVIVIIVPLILAQRSPYAGSRPNGYKDKFVPQVQVTQPTTSDSGLLNRVGGETTKRIPIEAMGDISGFNLLSQRPIEQQPFWLINYQHIEAHKQKPQLQTNPIATRGHFAGRR